MPTSTCEGPDGTWTVASHVVRSLSYGRDLTPAEYFFVLTSLDAERFRSFWDRPDLYEEAGTCSPVELRTEGDTERARQYCDRIPKTAEIVGAAAALLDKFIDTGDPAFLDEMVIVASPFGTRCVDDLILSEAIHSRDQPLGAVIRDQKCGGWVRVAARSADNRIAKLPERRLVILRRLGYPNYNFLPEYVSVLREIDVVIEPGDVVDGLLNVPWKKFSYWYESMLSPARVQTKLLDKKGIRRNREWLEIIVQQCPEGFDAKNWSTEESATAMLHRVYLFLCEQFEAMRGNRGWVKESQLGAALEVLFGKNQVERHVQPAWLGRQHLDLFLPRYALAVEYMGRQHFEPVEFFGGPPGLEEVKRRDARKRELCDRMGITLVYVTHEEEVARRAREIHATFGNG